jgi:hypothetical protein
MAVEDSPTTVWAAPDPSTDCGVLLARSKNDIADAAVAAVSLLAGDGDTLLTSDPQDIKRLLDTAGTLVRIRPV